MRTERTAEGVKQRISKRSGAVIPFPEGLAQSRRAVRPPEPGLKDTPAPAVARVTYAPDAALLPYLAAGGKLWERAGARGARPALPKLLRGNVRWRSRRKIRGKFELDVERARLEKDVEALTRGLQRAARTATAAGAAAAAAAAGAPAAAAAGPDLR